MNTTVIAAILIYILFGVSGQILLKQGVRYLGDSPTSMDDMLIRYLKVLFTPYIIAGLFCFVLSTVIWLYVLSQVDLSVAFPFLGLNFILVMLGASVFFGEPITLPKIVGVLAIVFGIVVIARG